MKVRIMAGKEALRKVVLWGGVVVVVATHVYMLASGLPEEQMTAHAVVNLIAAGAVVYGIWK